MSDNWSDLVGQIADSVSKVGGATASVIGAVKGSSGSVSSGGSTYVYGNSGDTSALPKWLLPVFAIFGLFLIFKRN